MKYRNLGHTDITISQICLGTMTWGQQNSEADGFSQMDYAVDHGVNFFDTAELYAVPPSQDTYGATETIIGNWFKARGGRDKVILATKISCQNVAGQNPDVDYMRDGAMTLDKNNIETALNASLKRLQTDYVDLYQIHWPERGSNFFGKLGYDVAETAPSTPLEDTLRALSDMVKSGKVRAIGLSNETPWGTMEFLRLADKMGLSRMVSVQNPYSLLNRTYEIGMAEISWQEKCGLLAYSPLGFGVLSGKYLKGQRPDRARITLFPYLLRYVSAKAEQATQRYVDVALAHGLNPAQMALAFVNSRPFVTATIVGATTLAQLKDNIASVDVDLDDAVCEQIEAIHQDIPNPAP